MFGSVRFSNDGGIIEISHPINTINMNRIHLVISVERTPCSSLDGMFGLGTEHMVIPEAVQWEPIDVRPHPVLTISDKIEEKVRMWTTTLKFFTCHDLGDTSTRYVYRLKFAGGNYALIGSSSRPFPVLTVQRTAPEKPSDNQWNEASVSWTTAFPPQTFFV